MVGELRRGRVGVVGSWEGVLCSLGVMGGVIFL